MAWVLVQCNQLPLAPAAGIFLPGGLYPEIELQAKASPPFLKFLALVVCFVPEEELNTSRQLAVKC